MFLDKNRDAVHRNLVELLQESSCEVKSIIPFIEIIIMILLFLTACLRSVHRDH